MTSLKMPFPETLNVSLTAIHAKGTIACFLFIQTIQPYSSAAAEFE